MPAELKGKPGDYYIDGMNSNLMGRIAEKACPSCRFRMINVHDRSRICQGMGSMSPEAPIIQDATPERVMDLGLNAPCLKVPSHDLSQSIQIREKRALMLQTAMKPEQGRFKKFINSVLSFIK